MRRLNEHGQNVIESLMRSADQALRDSCARLFEGLSEIIRERAGSSTNAASVAGFTPPSNHEPGDASSPHNQASFEATLRSFSAPLLALAGCCLLLACHFPYRFRHVGDLLVGQLRVHGQAEHAVAGAFGARESPLRTAQRGIGRLQMDGLGVVNHGFDFASGELRDHRAAIVHVDHELVVNALVARIVDGEFDARAGECACDIRARFPGGVCVQA